MWANVPNPVMILNFVLCYPEAGEQRHFSENKKRIWPITRIQHTLSCIPHPPKLSYYWREWNRSTNQTFSACPALQTSPKSTHPSSYQTSTEPPSPELEFFLKLEVFIKAIKFWNIIRCFWSWTSSPSDYTHITESEPKEIGQINRQRPTH